MTDQFEEWLEKQVDIAARTYYHNKTLESVLAKYREFLKEQKKQKWAYHDVAEFYPENEERLK